MGRLPEWWKWRQEQQCGIIRESRRSPSAGCLFVTPMASLTQPPCCAPIKPSVQRRLIEWFVLRWQVEVTFHEVRTHLGVETQRQWSDLAILRTTPALLGLFSLVTLFAQQLLDGHALPLRQAAWYDKALPTFTDTLAFVRQHFWPMAFSFMSPGKPEMVEIPRALIEHLTQMLAFTA